MNRRGFIARLAAAVAAAAVAPALDLLAEPETPCGGLMWQIENTFSTSTYSPLTMEMLDEMVRELDNGTYIEELIIFGRTVIHRR